MCYNRTGTNESRCGEADIGEYIYARGGGVPLFRPKYSGTSSARNRPAARWAKRNRRPHNIGTIAAVSALFLCLTTASCAGAAGQKTVSHQGVARSGPLTFALSTSFTGANASIGKIFYAASKVACDQINNAGGVLGHQCKLITIDDRSDPADGVIALRQALSQNSNIVAIEGLGSQVAPAEVPIIASAHILALSGAGESIFVHPNTLLKSNAKYLYMLQPPDAMQGFAMAEAAKQLHVTHPALVFVDDPTTAPVLSGVEEAFASLHINIAINLRISAGQASYGTEVARLVQAHPNGIIFEADPQSSGTFFANLKTELGTVAIPLIGDLNAVNASWYKAVEAALPISTLSKWAIIVSPKASATNGPGSGPLAAAWNSFNTGAGFSSTGAFVEPLYDAFILTALAMLEAKSTSPSMFAPYLASVAAHGSMKGLVKVYSYRQGKSAIAAGKKIAYLGAFGALGWSSLHVRVPDFVIQHYALSASGPTTSANSSLISGAKIASALHL